MATNVVSIGSDLERKKWMREGLVQAASKSFWSPYTGATKDGIVFQSNNASAGAGHTVVFDFDGNLSGRAIKGKSTASGNGEQKKKFSDSLTVDRYRLVVDNGDKFDAVNVDNLAGAEHANSRAGLADLFIRFKDQALFDTAQGFKDGAAPSHTIQIDASSTPMSYKDLVDIEKKLRTGTGYKTGAFGSATNTVSRAPLAPYRLADGRSIWLMVVDPLTAANIKGNTAAGSILALASSADVRGSNNMVFRGLLGKIGQLVIVEAELFFGETINSGLDGSEIEVAGMRAYDGANSAWSGEAGYANAVFSRNLILGKGALQCAFGKQPDYKYKESEDFGISSESAVEFWMDSKKTFLNAENGEYKKAKISGLDYSVIAVDVKLV